MIQSILSYQVNYFLLFISLFSYLIGSVSFAILISKARGLDDPRAHGSNNPGATNVMRTGDSLAALLTLAGDAFKGFLAVFLVKIFWVDTPLTQDETIMVSVSMISVFMGHLFPVF